MSTPLLSRQMGKLIVTGSADKSVRLWDAASARQLVEVIQAVMRQAEAGGFVEQAQ